MQAVIVATQDNNTTVGDYHGVAVFSTTPRGRNWYYELVEPGFNWRATDIQCALGLSQLAKLPRFAARRRSSLFNKRKWEDRK